MKIYFHYNKYPDSPGSTLLSYFANMLLALDSMVVIPVVICAVAFIIDDGLSLGSIQMVLAAIVCVGYIILYLAITLKHTEPNLAITLKHTEPKVTNPRYTEQEVQKQAAIWLQEAEDVKQLYPSFNINTEIQNGNFCELLKKGASVKQAYEQIHKDEILNTPAHTEKS